MVGDKKGILALHEKQSSYQFYNPTCRLGEGKVVEGWLRHYATSRKVADLIPDVVIRVLRLPILPAALWPWGRPRL